MVQPAGELNYKGLVKLLLAEDDGSLRDTLTEGLTAAGYEVVAVPNGAAALEAAQAGGFQAAVLDGLMPKATGFDVAKQLRSLQPDLGVVLMSGVFKSNAQQSDQLKATGARAYLVKPFDLAKLLEALRPFAPAPNGSTSAPTTTTTTTTAGAHQGRGAQPQQPLPPEGNLLETPVMYLGWRIEQEGHTGILELFGTAERARLFVYRGQVIFAQHSDPTLHVGVELLKEGLVTPEQFKDACDLAVQRGVGIAEVIKAEELATEQQLRLAYKTLVPQIVERVAAMTGRFRYTATDAHTSIVPAATAPLVASLLGGVARAAEKDLEPHVNPRRPLRLAPGGAWNDVAPLLGSTLGSDSLTRAINGRATIAQLIEVSPTPAERVARYRQVYVLMSTMAVQASMEPIPMARPATPSSTTSLESPPSSSPFNTPGTGPQPPPRTPTPAPAPAREASRRLGGAAPMREASRRLAPLASPDLDKGLTFSPEDQAARQRISATYRDFENKDYWTILSVARGADAATLKKAYFALSREWHPDSFAGLQLGSAQRELDALFALIQDAYATLSDENKRGEYEAKMNFSEKGASTDVAAIFQAESDFNRIKILVERGDLSGALKLIAPVAEVLVMNEEAQGYRAFLEWWPTKNIVTADGVVKKLQDWHKAMPAAHSLAEFQGWIAMELQNFKLARNNFKRVLDAEPNNPGASRGMRAALAKMQEQEKAASSGLGRFLKR